MLSTKELNELGYYVSFMPTMYDNIDNPMEHIVLSGDDVIFRAYGRSICKVESKEHLLKLTEENKTSHLSFLNYPLKNNK